METVIQEFRRNLRTLEREIAGRLKSETHCCGITAAQCHILLELELSGEMTITSLASGFALDKSTLSRTVETLVRSGLLSRRENPEDRRHSFIMLTAEGKKKAEAVNSLCNESYRRLLSYLPEDDYGVIMTSISKLAAAMAAFRQDETGSVKGCCITGGD